MPIRQSFLAVIASTLLCQCQSYKPDFAAAEERNEVRAAENQAWRKALAAARAQAQANDGMQAVVVAHTDLSATPQR